MKAMRKIVLLGAKIAISAAVLALPSYLISASSRKDFDCIRHAGRVCVTELDLPVIALAELAGTTVTVATTFLTMCFSAACILAMRRIGIFDRNGTCS